MQQKLGHLSNAGGHVKWWSYSAKLFTSSFREHCPNVYLVYIKPLFDPQHWVKPEMVVYAYDLSTPWPHIEFFKTSLGYMWPCLKILETQIKIKHPWLNVTASAWEIPELQRWTQKIRSPKAPPKLYSEFEVCLHYIRPCIKNKTDGVLWHLHKFTSLGGGSRRIRSSGSSRLQARSRATGDIDSTNPRTQKQKPKQTLSKTDIEAYPIHFTHFTDWDRRTVLSFNPPCLESETVSQKKFKVNTHTHTQHLWVSQWHMPINLDIWHTEVGGSQGKPGLHSKVKNHVDNLLRPYLKRKMYRAGSRVQAYNTRFGMKLVTFISLSLWGPGTSSA